MGSLFGEVRARSTLGSFLRSFTRLFSCPGWPRPPLSPGGDVLGVRWHAKADAGFGHTKIQGKGLLVEG
jgi:hypothetical protein